MGWWESHTHPDDVIGDGPADILMDAFTAIVAAADPDDTPIFTLDAFLGQLLGAIAQAAPMLFAPGERAPGRLVATLPDGTTVTSAPRSRADARHTARLADALRAVAVEYEQAEPARRPRPSEILETVRFVLGYRPPAYERITDAVAIDRIEGEHA